jgi:GNAT superfamily N-acetyltransferase
MNDSIPTEELIRELEASEMDYMIDRMEAIEVRTGNPEGIEIQRFGHAICLYSRTMPWPSFNTVKGIRNEDIDLIDQIIAFYRARERKPQFEIVPHLMDQSILKSLADRGFYQSGFHTSTYITPTVIPTAIDERIQIHEISENEFELYATIHCRGTGLPDDGIPHVAQNNRILYNRPGWTFFLADFEQTPAAVGVMYRKRGTASFTFAATLPEFRKLGLQQHLLNRRIKEAAVHNCRLAVSQCAFLSQSHRNMERVGMRIGYIRTTWTEK